MNVMMYVMCRKILELLGKTTANDGKPQVGDNDGIDEGTLRVPMKHH
jgi:hypothetical protein